MAAQILKTNHTVLAASPVAICEDANRGEREEGGSVLRGFFYAMLLNLFLLLTTAAGWGVWHLLR